MKLLYSVKLVALVKSNNLLGTESGGAVPREAQIMKSLQHIDLPVKQEVVVMLPPDWEDMERIRPQVVSAQTSAKKTQLDLQPGDPLTTRPQIQERVSYPAPPVKVQNLAPQTMQHLRSPVRKNTKIGLHPNSVVTDHGAVEVDRVQSICKALPAPKHSHVRQCPEGCFSQDKHGTPEQIHAERSHHCTQCGKKFARACDLKAHSLIHKGKKPLSCSQCDQTFTYNFELKAHQRNHSGERPHVCPHCGKAFTRMSNFRQHQNIHTREKLFSCTQCGMRFNRATNLRVHLRRHSHAGKTYNCPHCGKSFLNPRQMKAHLLKVHGRGGK
uniref:C2H2-type domain-containing protein n=1 Tax=Sinocyclocheilus anshuiensis TaxID=1608454 RepID=A0A671KCI9_9TELE